MGPSSTLWDAGRGLSLLAFWFTVANSDAPRSWLGVIVFQVFHGLHGDSGIAALSKRSYHRALAATRL